MMFGNFLFWAVTEWATVKKEVPRLKRERTQILS